MLNVQELLNLDSSILNCWRIICEAARCHETHCVIKPKDFSQANTICEYFRGNGFNVSISIGLEFYSGHSETGYLIISWGNDDKKTDEIDLTESN